MNLSGKERVCRVFQRQAVDRIPTQINYTARMEGILADYFHIPPADLPEFLETPCH